MCALLTFRLVIFLDDEARISLPGFVSITRDPVHLVCMGKVGAILMSNVVKLCGFANNMMIICVEISSNFMSVMLTTTVAIMLDWIFFDNYLATGCREYVQHRVLCRTD